MTPSTQRRSALEWVIVRAQAGDDAAVEEVLQETARLATPVLRRIVGEASDDVLQGVLWDVSRKLRWLEHPRAFGAWIYRIAVRAALKHLKRERRQWPFDVDEDLEQVAAPIALGEVMQKHLIEELVAAVSPGSRVVIVLHYLEEMPLEEVATVLDIPIGTVKSRLAYGLAALRRVAREKGL